MFGPQRSRLRLLSALGLTLAVSICLILSGAVSAHAADRQQIEDFLEVTGFDVALDSIAHSAENAPGMIGIDPVVFGAQWEIVAEDVFDRDEMYQTAIGFLEKSLRSEALLHAASFYASDLGQRLVQAENATHDVQDGDVIQAAGERIISMMVQNGDPKLGIFRDMQRAIDAGDSALRAVQEIQIRFITAAQGAGLVDLGLDEETLREVLRAQETDLRIAMQQGSLANSAYAYQGFSEVELQDYVDALEHPLMQEVYELLNAIQFEIQADRFEELAYRMRDLVPAEDL